MFQNRIINRYRQGYVEPTRPSANRPDFTNIPETSEEIIIRTALKYLSNHDTDHARYRNDIGFNASDSRWGNRLASYSRLTFKAQEEALRRLQKYQRSQLLPAGIILPTYIPQPVQQVQVSVAEKPQAPRTEKVGGELGTVRVNSQATWVVVRFTGKHWDWINKIKALSTATYHPEKDKAWAISYDEFCNTVGPEFIKSGKFDLQILPAA